MGRANLAQTPSPRSPSLSPSSPVCSEIWLVGHPSQEDLTAADVRLTRLSLSLPRQTASSSLLQSLQSCAPSQSRSSGRQPLWSGQAWRWAGQWSTYQKSGSLDTLVVSTIAAKVICPFCLIPTCPTEWGRQSNILKETNEIEVYGLTDHPLEGDVLLLNQMNNRPMADNKNF